MTTNAIILISIETSTIIFLHAKLKKSDEQTNIDKYKVTAQIILQNMISKSEQKFNSNTSFKSSTISISKRFCC